MSEAVDPNDLKYWRAAVDGNGRKYFFNKITKETTWERPAGFVETKPPARHGEQMTMTNMDEYSRKLKQRIKEEKAKQQQEILRQKAAATALSAARAGEAAGADAPPTPPRRRASNAGSSSPAGSPRVARTPPGGGGMMSGASAVTPPGGGMSRTNAPPPMSLSTVQLSGEARATNQLLEDITASLTPEQLAQLQFASMASMAPRSKEESGGETTNVQDEYLDLLQSFGVSLRDAGLSLNLSPELMAEANTSEVENVLGSLVADDDFAQRMRDELANLQAGGTPTPGTGVDLSGLGGAPVSTNSMDTADADMLAALMSDVMKADTGGSSGPGSSPLAQ